MKYHEDPNFRVLATLMACGVLSSLVVLFSIYLYFQRREGDPFFASDEYRLFQERQAVKNVRQRIAEEFVDAVIKCISPPIMPGSLLTEQEVAERLAAATGNTSGSNGISGSQTCDYIKSTHWTFEAPCKLAISKSFSKASGGLNLGVIEICPAAMASIIHSAIGNCAAPGNFLACLESSVLANGKLKQEIERPVEAVAGVPR
ncbi:MAG: hypothetical protein L0Y57_11750 [Beijerinckiaceae bacterium]|nr:hypothetical protein [Beijerinckiaceae bacterium]